MPHNKVMFDMRSPQIAEIHVHILMGTFNGGLWIGEQLNSFLQQTHQYWTLWVSDDGSSDDTRTQLEAFAHNNPGRLARILDGPRQGSAANFLNLLCHPDLPLGVVALSDQDDVWMPHKLARAIEQLNIAGPDACVWSARYMIKTTEFQTARVSPVWSRGPSLQNALVQNILSGHTLTLNPAALALVRLAGRQKVPHHDWWIYLIMMACGARALFDHEVVLHYRQHDANTVGERYSKAAKLKRFLALMNGELGAWIAQNIHSLQAANDLPITAVSAEVLQCWQCNGSLSRLRRLHHLKIHRQSRSETAILYLAAIFRKL
jgi:glycosyltransferase involved in cell wall biosynthesis